MTQNELRNHIQSICEDNYKLIDVLYYTTTHDQLIVIVYERHYSHKTAISSVSFATIQEAIIYFDITDRIPMSSHQASINPAQTEITLK